MFLSLEDLDALKFEASVIGKKFPHQAAEKLNQLLHNDTIQAEEFIAEFNKIVASTETLTSKNIGVLGNIKERFFDSIIQFSWLQIGGFIFLFLASFYIYKKFKLKKRLKKYRGLVGNLLERFFALLGYLAPVNLLYLSYVDQMIGFYPYLNLIYPSFLKQLVFFSRSHQNLVNPFIYFYFFAVIYISISLKVPRSRFIRFHFVRGLMLVAFQGLPSILLSMVDSSASLTANQMLNSYMLIFAINMCWILPCLFQAITHTYPKSSFIREAIEVQLGRDRDDKFKWWDR